MGTVFAPFRFRIQKITFRYRELFCKYILAAPPCTISTILYCDGCRKACFCSCVLGFL